MVFWDKIELSAINWGEVQEGEETTTGSLGFCKDESFAKETFAEMDRCKKPSEEGDKALMESIT